MSHCAICLECSKDPFQSKCSHSFCNKCIMQWITQHDDCPLCRKPISDTPTTNSNDEDERTRDYYMIFRNYKKLSDEEENEIDGRLDDFINTIGERFSVYKWKETNEGSWYTTIRKQNYCIIIKLYIDDSHIEPVSMLETFQNIYVTINKREFYKTKQTKYKKKQLKLNKYTNKSYLYR